MKNKSNWSAYYQLGDIESYLYRKVRSVEWSLRDITKRYPAASVTEKVCVLGGFHPFTRTVGTFKYICESVWPGAVTILLDRNEEPFFMREDLRQATKVQALLEELPFKDGSVDFLMLDFTVDFMSDDQLRSLSKSADRVLTESGLVLMTKTLPPKLERAGKTAPVPVYPRYLGKLVEIMADLKLVYCRVDITSSIIMMAVQNSVFSHWPLSKDDSEEETPWFQK